MKGRPETCDARFEARPGRALYPACSRSRHTQNGRPAFVFAVQAPYTQSENVQFNVMPKKNGFAHSLRFGSHVSRVSGAAQFNVVVDV